jgi:hypothetical protein
MATAWPVGAATAFGAVTDISGRDPAGRDAPPGAGFGDEAIRVFPHEAKQKIKLTTTDVARTAPTAVENGPPVLRVVSIHECRAIIRPRSFRLGDDSFIALVPPAPGLCKILFRLGFLA